MASGRRLKALRILLVEDEPELGHAVAERLRREGYVVDRAASLAVATAATLGAAYRAVLLDRRLPDGDGLSLLPILRTRPEPPPAIVLTAMDDVSDRVAGLDAGADDYLVKPFAADELLARLRVLLRRATADTGGPDVVVGALSYLVDRQEARVGGAALIVPRRESAVLGALVRRAGRTVLRGALEDAAYGYDDEVGPNALEAIVSRLRRRLDTAGAGVEIRGVRGVGYLLRAAS
jgi:DNA-binding response OmpR family regulator